ncbi:MAG: hypothetical protein HWE39_12940 [Oceanospirillaceae bacterium]|nr:hypothetical protein [Oceanospirillaceae bacterium]
MNHVKPGKGLGRKPAHMSPSFKSGQDVIWMAARELNEFTRDDITMWIHRNQYQSVNDKTVRSYLSRLVKGGYIEVSKKIEKSKCATLYQYRLIKDCGVFAPKINKNGEKVTQGQGRANLWRTMKILKVFSWRELVASASTDTVTIAEMEAKRYVSLLHKAGYLTLLTESNWRTATVAQYRFNQTKNTGPLPPQIQRTKAVFDPNINEVVWTPSKQEDVA